MCEELVGAQMIFNNKAFPNVDPGSLLRYCHTANHWSTAATTVALWRDIILPYVTSKRAACGDPAAPVLVLADAFTAHWCEEVKKVVAEVPGIAYIGIPDSLPHLFQPLDLGIIAAIKQSVLRRKDVFLQKEVETAVAENRGVTLSRSRPILRDKVTLWIKEVLADPELCSERCCRAGFVRSGVLGTLFGVEENGPQAHCEDCGELGRSRYDLPDCAHFEGMVNFVLCNGCMQHHRTFCEVVGSNS